MPQVVSSQMFAKVLSFFFACVASTHLIILMYGGLILKLLIREIAFDDIEDEDIITRAWEDLLPNNRILIYCL